MSMTEARADLVRSLFQSCYVIEHGRAGLQRRWGGDFDRDAARTLQRADRLGALLDERGFRRPDEVIEPHTTWWASFCGATADEVPLGAAALHQFGKWPTLFMTPYLGLDAQEFSTLGKEHTRVELDVLPLTEDQAFLTESELPPGRRFVILTDVHLGARGQEELARRAIADINEIAPEFVVIPGDITDDGEPEQFRLAKEIFDDLRCPYYVVPGNHDAVQRSTRAEIGPQLFAEVFGSDPVDHVVECGELQVALVNSSDPTASPFPDWDMATGEMGGRAAGIDSGALRPGQAEELAQRLDTSRPALLVQHHELHPFPGFPPVRFALREEDAKAELDALASHDLVGIVAGHTHRSFVTKVGDRGVTQLEIPSLKDWPFAFSVAGVSSEGVRVVVRQLSDRSAVLTRAQRLPLVTTRFLISPLAQLDFTFPS